MTERLHFHFSLSCIGEGNGTPLQRSCLENLPSRVSAPECKANAEKKSKPGTQAKGKFISGKREGDWPLRRTSVLLF